MGAESFHGPAVLVVDADASIRALIAKVLEHAGFRTFLAGDDHTATRRDPSRYAVIIRDLKLTPGESKAAMQQLAAWPIGATRRDH